MRLVLDVCVLGTANNLAAPGSEAKSCWLFLNAFSESQHVASISKDLEKEWSESRKVCIHAYVWWHTLFSKKRLDYRYSLLNTRNPRLRAKIRSLINRRDMCSSKIDKMIDDVHLIELALLTDDTIVSIDRKDRKKFCEASVYINALNSIVWADPHKHRTDIIQWLNAGANPVEEWKLGYVTS